MAGVAFFTVDSRLRYGHFIWHLFVLAGTACHFFAVLGYAATASSRRAVASAAGVSGAEWQDWLRLRPGAAPAARRRHRCRCGDAALRAIRDDAHPGEISGDSRVAVTATGSRRETLVQRVDARREGIDAAPVAAISSPTERACASWPRRFVAHVARDARADTLARVSGKASRRRPASATR